MLEYVAECNRLFKFNCTNICLFKHILAVFCSFQVMLVYTFESVDEQREGHAELNCLPWGIPMNRRSRDQTLVTLTFCWLVRNGTADQPK
jgi:hypothetical protein